MQENSKIIKQTLDKIVGQCFGRYAKYIIQDRALPDARDGLKPVQRRILYAMNELGLNFDKPYKKSARTVGEVIGKYHPHGDSSIYEAMVRMSQNWKNNIPLLDMHGNNGSIDGDGAAAMRYTECRLSEIANLMLDNIKNETVEFTYNFDDSEKEPTILPTLFPNLLINGAVGIAAGYATNIPPFNPSEIFDLAIQMIDNPKMDNERILSICPGPDFPTGGIIENKQGIIDLYQTGKGKFIVSSKIQIDESDKKNNRIIITEIPYDTNKSQILKEISEIIFEEKISGIIEMRDESDQHGINIIIECKKEKNITAIVNYLLKNTHLQIKYSANFVAIVDRKPTLLTIREAINHYLKYALNIQLKIAQFSFKKAIHRFEIVNGLIKASNYIDQIIQIIRQSDSKESSKNNLIQTFGFSEIQVEAIVTLRLYRLSKTDSQQLKDEASRLKLEIARLELLINSEDRQKIALKEKILTFKQKYGYKRKTLISNEIKNLEINELDVIDNQEVYVSVSRDGYLKTLSKKAYETNLFQDLGHKEFDLIILEKKCFTNQTLYLITRLGKTISIPVYKIKNTKWKEIGVHINNLVAIGSNDKIIFANVLDNLTDEQLIIVTKNSMIKKVACETVFNPKIMKPSFCFKLKEDDTIISCKIINPNKNYFISVINNHGYGYSFSSADVPVLQKSASGIKTMKLKPNESLVSALISLTLTLNCTMVYKNSIVTIPMRKFPILSRQSIGKRLNKNKDPLLTAIITNNFSSIALIDQNNTLQLVQAKDDKVISTIIMDAHFNDAHSTQLNEIIDEKTILPKTQKNHDEQEQMELKLN